MRAESAPGSPAPVRRGTRQPQEAAQLRQQQRADMQLRDEAAALYHAHEGGGRDEPDGESRLRLKVGNAFASLDEEGMDAVTEPAGAGSSHAQHVDRARAVAGFLGQF